MQQNFDIPAALSPSEQECLLCIVGHMIPASAAYGVPGADDPTIFADMLGSIRRDGEALRMILARVDGAAGGRLADMAFADQAALLARLRSDEPGLFGPVEAVVSRAYYRDDRVLKSIGMDARPPFPRGYEVEPGDLSLLEPVRLRGPIYRDAN